MTDNLNMRRDTVWQAESLSNTYLDGVRGAIPLAAEQIDILVRLARAAQPAARTILDLGCGDGILAHALLDAYAGEATAVLVDFSPPMLDAAQARLAGYPTRFIAADYADPDWQHLLTTPPQSFDVVVSGYSIHHQPDAIKRRLYRECYDLLAPGGVFLNLEHVASTSRWGEEQFEAYFIDALHRYHAPNGKTREDVATGFYHRPDKSANLLTSVELQCDWLREIGFAQVDCFFKVFELALFGGMRPPIGAIAD